MPYKGPRKRLETGAPDAIFNLSAYCCELKAVFHI